jgi:hypothetical protein
MDLGWSIHLIGTPMRRVAGAWVLCVLSRESSTLNSLGARLSKFLRLTAKHHPTRPIKRGGIGATRHKGVVHPFASLDAGPASGDRFVNM